MIVVSDTSPICYLILIGEIQLLQQLFDEVRVPQAVLAELLHEYAPAQVRLWAQTLPPWVLVMPNPALSITGLEKLQSGEQSAILLAESILAGTIILDEKAARRVATNRGLRVIGILGVLDEAATRGLVDPALAIGRLKMTNFRSSPALLKSLIDRHGKR